MEVTTTNSLGETRIDEMLDSPVGSVYINNEYNEKELDSPETLEAVEQFITSNIEENSIPQMNRAKRRALAKKAGKKGRDQLGTISETARKLNYINLIQRLRKMKEKNDNEQATEN